MTHATTAATQVAVVGSPSTNADVAIDILASATHDPLIGQMLFLTHPINTPHGERIEAGIGVVTQITQTNKFHADPALRSAIKQHGSLKNLTGDAADARTASVTLQASYIQSNDADTWRQSGVGLSTAPPTGSPVRQLTNDVLDDFLASQTTDLHYLGYLHGSATRGGRVRAPFSIPDFNGPEGSSHSGFFGLSGAGKTAIAATVLAGQFRHRDLGLIIVDPQGQWASETGMPFSLQGFASELGRPVIVKRISEDLRLAKDAPLFVTLLGKTKFLQEIGRMGGENQELLLDEFGKIVRGNHAWDAMSSTALLRLLLETVIEEKVSDGDTRSENPYPYLGRVYADPKRCDRLRDQIKDILDDNDRMRDVLRYFSVIHNLFQATNPAGGAREPLRHVVGQVINRSHTSATPAPMLVLDMSTTDPSWLSSALADDEQLDVLDALAILDQDNIKAAILRQVGTAMKITSEAAFRAGGGLNTIILIDEAWRYMPPLHAGAEPEIEALSKDFAGYAKDWRKFGLGLWFISQTTRSINPDIWDQLTIRFLGYGLGGADLNKITDHLDSPDSLRLYKAFAAPKATQPRIYPWLVMGPVSPLSFTNAPIAIAAYTNFDDFRADNHHWLTTTRQQLGLPPATGTPAHPNTPQLAAAAAKLAKASRTARDTTGASAKVQQQIAEVREHRTTGGVNLATYNGHSTDDGFSTADPLADDPPPF